MTHYIETGRIYHVRLRGIGPPLHVRTQRQSEDRPNFWVCESLATGARLELTESAYWRLDDESLIQAPA